MNIGQKTVKNPIVPKRKRGVFKNHFRRMRLNMRLIKRQLRRKPGAEFGPIEIEYWRNLLERLINGFGCADVAA